MLPTSNTLIKKKESQLILFIISLVIMSQMAITIYLPSMPHMVAAFNTSTQSIQLSLTVYLIGYGITQFIYGPLSDIYGRRKIILCGVSIFVVASLLCTFAGSITFFLVGRLLQGIGIGCGDTMGRAILCDKFEGPAFVKAACHIGLAATVTPLIGPLIGSYVEIFLSWQISFFIIFLYSFMMLIVFYFYLPETKACDSAKPRALSSILQAYAAVIGNRVFLRFFFPGLACFLGELAYNLMSSFLLQNQLGRSPVEFGWLNMLTIAGLLIGTTAANFSANRVSYIRMVSFGMWLLSISAMFMLIPALFNLMNIVTIIMPMMLFMIGVGIIYPNTNMGALSPFSAGFAGTAGALQGGLQMVLGGLLGLVLSHVATSTQLPLAITLILLTLSTHGAFIVLSPSHKRIRFIFARRC